MRKEQLLIRVSNEKNEDRLYARAYALMLEKLHGVKGYPDRPYLKLEPATTVVQGVELVSFTIDVWVSDDAVLA